jgi:outer membrane protein assembly factor BamD (BamD/ComL family)
LGKQRALAKANPLLGQGLAIDAIEKFVKALNQPPKSEISRQKTYMSIKSLIYNEIWMKGRCYSDKFTKIWRLCRIRPFNNY